MKHNSGWKSILQSAECREVLAQVVALRKKGERVYPIQKDVFRAFEDCPFKHVRVVILGQDPYANEGQAVGRAFAVSESTEMPPSLKNIFKEVWHDYPLRLTPKPTLESWAKQGVFLLNITLTVAHGRFKQPRQHWVERRSGHEFQRGVGMLHFFPGCVMDSFVIL